MEVAQFLAHLAEKAVLERLQLAQGKHLRVPLSALSRSLDEVEDIAFFLLGDLALGDIFENAAKRVAHLRVVAVGAERLDGDLV
eukprot:CAMPEP_0185576198 /NCGR_PEP_ID=MMETSP0434-20130131/7176_1 /TAXON_ID=626734 ORGANISM="Favella taraikaensis, Strain Fe Narragansett Bay" /NCGR_SAMPLE_ID=MMETSP0434 /ASSEMBLY_ACC=CAM_ASM_000379 /LENGTH=83 /DNA_ID=CAMNT_0028193301 /DNA_START=2248 /DNA_END=2499 /DNA_ORIENTATION=-